MSEVRRGFDTVLLRPVAIKLLRDEGDRTSVARFEREAHVLANLQHPSVVAVFDVGTDGEDRYIVMELVEGPTLRDVLSQEGRLETHRAAVIAAKIAAALAYAHDRDIVHRDVKPSNVLIASRDRVKLADLGIAKLLNTETLATRTGLLGTANYIAPEQVRGGPMDGRADLYSLGCVLFEMLVGRPPFEGDVAALAYAHVHTPAPRLHSLDPAVPESLDTIVASLLEKDPSARPQTAAEVGAALEPITRTAGGRAAGAGEPLASPAPTVRLPRSRASRPPAETLTSPEPTRWLPGDRESPPPVDPLTNPAPSQRPPLKRPPARRWIAPAATLVGVLLVLLLPVLAQSGLGPNDGSFAPTGRTLRFVSVAPMDPYGDSHENDSGMPLVADNDPLTAWKTENYLQGVLNKPGVGMLFDLGSRGTVTGFRLQTPSPGYRFTVLVGDDPTTMLESDGDTFVAAADVRESIGPVNGQYVLLWITTVVPVDDGNRAEVGEFWVMGP